MAIIGTDQEEEDQRPTSSSSANAKASIPTTGTGGTGFVGGTGTGSGQGATTGVAPQNSGGGSYANLSQYLQANQDTGGTTGQAAENVVQQSANDATTKQGAYSDAASNEIDGASNGIGIDPNILRGINASTNHIDTAPTVAYTGPQTVGQFSGPTSSKQTDALGAMGIVDGNVKNANGGMSGNAALLKSAYTNPNYTQGENNLDAFLSGGTPGGQAALGQATGVGAGVSGNYSKINDMLNGKIQGANDTAAATNAFYNTTVGNQNTQTAPAPYSNPVAGSAVAAPPPVIAKQIPTSGGSGNFSPPDISTAFVNNPTVKGAEKNAGSVSQAGAPIKFDPVRDIPNAVSNAFGLSGAGTQGGSVASKGRASFRAAYGGEVPSYSKLRGMIK